MARTLSSTATSSALAEDTEEVWLTLLTISHPSLSQPIRVVNNNENVTSSGNLYVAYPFEITLPGESENGPSEVRLSIDNVDRVIVVTLRSIPADQPATVVIQVVLASSPDVIEAQIPPMKLRQTTFDAARVTGVLRFEELVVEPLAELITPARFPALF